MFDFFYQLTLNEKLGNLLKCSKSIILPALFLIVFISFFASNGYADYASNNAKLESNHIIVPAQWKELQPVLDRRTQQKIRKMKLSESEARNLQRFLSALHEQTPNLLKLQNALPKTTLELLRAIHERGLTIPEAEKMAACLYQFTQNQGFRNVSAFDENTSHIIGREWHEIDYTGEGMTWQTQRKNISFMV